MINEKIKLVFSELGEKICIGIQLPEKERCGQNDIEQVYNFFYNFGLTNSYLHTIIEGRFSYFFIYKEDMRKVEEAKSPVTQHILNLLKDMKQESFISTNTTSGYVYKYHTNEHQGFSDCSVL